ncbi:uncharacterized protein LOC124112852 [Haliotis rufescens]|uniref:uncharacterized protein LOC124112852 n=1 Tax=Haliotis rufescens TaxID=6454 RepID=UPI00201E8375|nr:uncharacterized protein LOC124112852 [Haliotis rufescens]
MVPLVVVAIVVIGTTMSDSASRDHTAAYCHTAYHRICQSNPDDHRIFCASDGKKYHGLCAYLLAHCEHKHITVVGHGVNCTNIHLTIPTQPPPSHFERGLYGAITHGIDDRLKAAKARNIPAAIAKNVYTKQDHAHKVYIRNKDCWAYGLDLTSISPWNSHMANRNAGTLVSPRHALWSRLHSIKVNSTLRFVDQNNNVVERRVIKSKTVGGPNVNGHDIVVGELDRDVPNTISFSKVMPRNLTKLFVPYNIHIPAMSTDQEEKVLVDDFYFYSSTHARLRAPLRTSIRLDFYEFKVSTVSGNPTFFVIDNQLVLLFVFTTGGAGGGTSINHYFDQINEIMVNEGGGYQLTEMDLSGAGGGTSINHYFDQINEIMAKKGGGWELREMDLSDFLE